MQVSVVLLTYNPDWTKLRQTLYSVICQQGIEFELIVSDDGSKEDCQALIKEYLDGQMFSRYRLLKCPENVGTVKNYMHAVHCAEGDYIYGISPGDFIYDEYVLRDFYRYCIEKNSAFCFGNCICYNEEQGGVISVPNAPKVVALYNDNVSDLRRKSAICFDEIFGLSFFRSREATVKYIGDLCDIAKYMEDYTSALYAVLDGVSIDYYDRTIAFYEYGTGISDERKQLWQKRLSEDVVRVVNFLETKYPGEAVLDMMRFYKKNSDKRWLCRCYKLFRHPLLSLSALQNKRYPIRYTSADEENCARLRQILNTEK